MATSVKPEDLAEHLKCAICLETFKDPKVLCCQHLYCRKCLERLVTKVGQEHFEITCPGCRRETEVPDGDVKGLPCNYEINNLLSKHSNRTPSCEKHDGEILKILCQSCDKLICRDCIAIDHRDHTFAFVKDIFPSKKEKIMKTIEESRVNIRSLKSSIESLEGQEDSLNKNFLEVNKKLDSVIDKQIELLQKKRQSVKDGLRKSVLIQRDSILAQKESIVSYLRGLETSVSATEKTLRKGSEVEVLLAKNQMIQQLTKINSATADLEPRGKVSYHLEANPPLDENTVGKMAEIREYDEDLEFQLVIPKTDHSGSWIFFGKLNGWRRSTFYIHPKRKNTRYCPDEVQVKIKLPDSNNVHSPTVNKEKDGSFSFSYYPGNVLGDYKIEITINGRYLPGSPFTWVVR